MLVYFLLTMISTGLHAQSLSFQEFQTKAKTITTSCLNRSQLKFYFNDVNGPDYSTYNRSGLIIFGDAVVTRPMEAILGGVGEAITHFSDNTREQAGYQKLAYLKHLIKFAASEIDLKFSYQRINGYYERVSGEENLAIIRPLYFEKVYTPYVQTLAKACFLKCVTNQIYTYNNGASEPTGMDLIGTYFDGTDNNPHLTIEGGAPICRHYADLYHELAPMAHLRTTRTSNFYDKSKLKGHSFIRLDFYREVENKIYKNYFYLEPNSDACSFMYEKMYKWQSEAFKFYAYE